jgi:hypothetical protein
MVAVAVRRGEEQQQFADRDREDKRPRDGRTTMRHDGAERTASSAFAASSGTRSDGSESIELAQAAPLMSRRLLIPV